MTWRMTYFRFLMGKRDKRAKAVMTWRLKHQNMVPISHFWKFIHKYYSYIQIYEDFNQKTETNEILNNVISFWYLKYRRFSWNYFYWRGYIN